MSARTGWLARIHSLTRSSTAARSSSRQRRAVGEVEAQLVRADVGAGLAHVRAEALAQRRVQQVRRRVVALGRAARVRGRRARRTRSPSCSSPARRLEHERLVVAEAHDVDDRARAVAVLALDHAGVGDLAAAGRVERRLDELGQHAAVLACSTAADRGRLLERLVAGEVASARPPSVANVAHALAASSSRPPRPAAARARARCSSISSSKPCSSTPRPCSAASSSVSSNGKP